jgi:Tol biopolymer transport system component
MSTMIASSRRRPAAAAALALLAAVVAAAGALALAPLGLTGLYVVAGVVGVVLLVVVLRDDLVPPLRAAVRRLDARRFGPRGPAMSPAREAVLVGFVACATGGMAFVLAKRGLLALLGVGGLLAVAVLAWLCWPLVSDLLRTPPADVPARRQVVQATTRRRGPGSLRRALRVLVAAGFAGAVAWAAAHLGIKGFVAVVGALVLGSLLAVVRDRSVFFTFAAVCSLTLVLHKSLSSQDLLMSGGAISVYVTSFDVLVLLLYALWATEGTMLADLRVGFRRRIMWLPLVAGVFLLPSLLVAPSTGHAASELTRMAWMYLLFVYVAIRVRTRRHVWAVLGGLAVFASVELVVVVLQWRTGGVLGLSFLGVPTELGDRVTDTTSIGRPFGTIIHPVFMGAALGSVSLVALAFAIELRRSLTKIAAVALVPVSLLPLYIAQTRASLVAVVMAASVVVVRGLVRGRLTWSTIRRAALALLVVGTLALPSLVAKFSANFGTGHFYEEVQSRLELNDIALRMIDDHMALGVGLNNFELVMPRYEQHPVIFFNNPVHNLYLLYLAETGVIGFIGVVVLGIGLYDVAIRLGRSHDRMLAAVGVGTAAAMGFLMVEELLGFSLRQDIPLAIYWLLAGLAVACTRLATSAGHVPRHVSTGPAAARGTETPRAQRRPHEGAVLRRLATRLPRLPRPTLAARRRAWALPAGVAAIALAIPFAPSGAAAGRPVAQPTTAVTIGTPSPTGMIAFTAVNRLTGVQGIYTAAPDGSAVTRITPADGRVYSWPRWAFGGTKIVYTVRSGDPGGAESIAVMDPDGSNATVLQDFEYRVAQPSVDPTGRWLLFTATTPWFPQVAVYRMDLRTLLSRNLTAVTEPAGGFDSDPAIVPSGRQALVAVSTSTGTSIERFGIDGTDRHAVTSGRWYDTDPVASPDGRLVALASYRGPGTPQASDGEGFAGVRTVDWHLVVASSDGASERVLTGGEDCARRGADDPCQISEMSAFAPRFSPDGRRVGFVGALDRTRTCICTTGLQGESPRELVSSTTLAIDWFDWLRPSGSRSAALRVGENRSTSRLLVTLRDSDGDTQLVDASADLMHRTVVPLPNGMKPVQARWAPDGRTIVLTAETPVPAADGSPHPAPPPGRQRRDHVTLSDVDLTSLALRSLDPQPLQRSNARKQVFLRSLDGSVRQVTDPWIEDWRDGVAPGDARSNTDPVLSADGHTLLVTNTSTTTGESFVLRIDLRSGEVLNLTNATSGALPATDAQAALSPDGRTVAFSWMEGAERQVYLMDVADGSDVRPATTARGSTRMPAWLPDGSALVVIAEKGDEPAVERVAVDGADRGRTHVLASDVPGPAWRPVVSPDGSSVLFLGSSVNRLNVFDVPTGGGTAQLLQADPLHDVLSVDWRQP